MHELPLVYGREKEGDDGWRNGGEKRKTEQVENR